VASWTIDKADHLGDYADFTKGAEARMAGHHLEEVTLNRATDGGGTIKALFLVGGNEKYDGMDPDPNATNVVFFEATGGSEGHSVVGPMYFS